jgi:hypothetical protein
LFLEYILNPDKPIRVSFPLMVGGGGATYVQWPAFGPRLMEDTQAMFVLEPEVEVEFNMLSFVKIALGINYKFTSNTQLNYQSSGDEIFPSNGLYGLTAGFTLKLGKF